MINGKISEDPQLIADCFNHFFTHVGPTLDNKIPSTTTDPLSYIPNNYTINIFLQPTTPEEIVKIIDKLRNCAVGWDGLPSSILKDNKYILSSVLTHIVNLSLTNGVFPEELKLGNIIPIFKSGDVQITGNYRPVSLLTTVSKVFERVFYTRLSSFFTKHKILFEMQFGFREGRSTYMAIIELLDKIIEATDKGEYAMGLFLDFSKAFDTVNHKILLAKLSHYGVRGVANSWVESYLDKRKQFSTYNDKRSKTETVLCGVPQGSILGPLLFFIYVNDLGSIFKEMNAILFADDTNLITTGNSIATLERKANREIPILVEWLKTNRLSLNIKKTHIMLFGKGNSKSDPLDINIKIDGTKLDIVQETKFLGIILDNKLSWKPHILYQSQKMAKSVGLISRARQLLNKKILVQIYYSFLYPYLTYGNIIWGQAAEINLWPIFKLQKRAIRLIENIPRNGSTTKSFGNLKIMRLPDIHSYQIMIFMFKFKKGLLPTLFDSYFSENASHHRYPTRRANQLRMPKVKSKIANSFIRKSGVTLWNTMAEKLEPIGNSSMAVFKKRLIIYLVGKYLD
jgi:hypothetical protein